jgi:hypothetical protein
MITDEQEVVYLYQNLTTKQHSEATISQLAELMKTNNIMRAIPEEYRRTGDDAVKRQSRSRCASPNI